jgi:hypothetical protein
MYLWPQFWNPAWLGRSTRDSADLVLEPGRVEEKIGEGTTWCDSADPATRLKTQFRSVDFGFFCFLLKRRHFDFFLKKLTRMTRWPGQNPGPGLGLKTMLMTTLLFIYLFIYLFICAILVYIHEIDIFS